MTGFSIMQGTATQTGITIIYDGECPFCSQFIRLMRLRSSVGPVELIDARHPHPSVGRISHAGLSLDDGMVAIYQDRIFHGDACLNLLASLTSPSTTFNKINAMIFRRKTTAKLLYPALRLGRNVTLRMLGRSKLQQ